MTAAVVESNTQSEDFEEFLDQHLHRGLLRFSTAGSVDDGKSTLIGRLLHDTKGIYDDQLAALKNSRLNRSSGPIDFSLLTDGLRAEREQGITIDVAYRYFATPRRKFIIADTPGHEQYTRNMATGASTADLAIVLIDAIAFERNGGLLPQSRRHTYLASLLGIPHVVAAVNKMDLAEYSESRFAAIDAAFQSFANELGLRHTLAIPISALAGDNIVERSQQMPWYSGPTLVEHLESVELDPRNAAQAPLRFPIQLVLRPDANFRGYAGQVASGTLRAGERVMALPSRRETTVRSIVTYDGNLEAAPHGMSVSVELEDAIDLSRGEMLVSPEHLPHIARRFRASVVWMHETPLRVGASFLAKHSTRTVRAQVTAIRHRVDIRNMQTGSASELGLNDIAEVEFETSKPLFFDTYRENRDTGNLILIDPLSNATVGAAMIESTLDGAETHGLRAGYPPPVVLHLAGQTERVATLAAALRGKGHAVVELDDRHIAEGALVSVIRAAQLAGAIAISAREALPIDEIADFVDADRIVELAVEDGVDELDKREGMDWL